MDGHQPIDGMAWIAPPGFKAGLERPAARRRILRPVLMHRRSLSNRASHGGRGGFALRNLFEDWGHTLRDFCREVNGGETTWRHSKNRANPSFTRLAGSDHRRKTPSRVPNSSASASGILCGWAVLRTCSPEITGRSTGCFDTLMRIQPASPRRQCRMKSPGESSNPIGGSAFVAGLNSDGAPGFPACALILPVLGHGCFHRPIPSCGQTTAR